MSERNMGQVVPFRLSAGKIRKGAYEHRRKGHPLEAVELLRRAAQQEDTPAGWLHLAEELRHLHCYEQAETLLYRLLADTDAPKQAWMELARCQEALNKREAAEDSLYHYLAEDPYSDVADEAHSMLESLEAGEDPSAPFRLGPMARRGLAAWRDGDHYTGQRRLERAILLAREPARLQVTLALLLMTEERYADALRLLTAALNNEPDHAQAACMMALALDALGRKRAARGMLQIARPLCDTVEGEAQFLSAARTMGAMDQWRDFLMERHRQTPYRITLLHHLADSAWEQDDPAQARALWQRILRLDPGDIRASAMMRWSRDREPGDLLPMGTLPGAERQAMLFSLVEADQQNLSPEAMLAPGSDIRMAVDWCFTLPNPGIQMTCLAVLKGQDTPVIRRYMKELLTSPTVLMGVRHQVMTHLAGLGETGPLNVLMGQRMSTAECQEIVRGKPKVWPRFLQGLLRSRTARHGEAEALAEFAAALWPMLTEEQHLDTAGPDGPTWLIAMEVLYLRLTGQDEEAAALVRESLISIRRVSRILRRIEHQLGPVSEEENGYEKVH